MAGREHLHDGSIRLTSAACGFLFTRLRPSVMLTTITGRDGGEFGGAPLAIVGAEAARFKRPVECFIDAKASVNASNEVFQRWTQWFSASAASLAVVAVISGTKPLELTVAISRHLSGLQSRMIMCADVAAFEDPIPRSVPASSGLPSLSRFDDPAASGRCVLTRATGHAARMQSRASHG